MAQLNKDFNSFAHLQYDDNQQQQSPSSYSSIPSLTSNDAKANNGGGGEGGGTPDPPGDVVGSTSVVGQCQYGGLSDKAATAAEASAPLVGQ